MRVALIEPYATGSHEEWARGYARASDFEVALHAMPGRFWKWRMHGAAVTMARRLSSAAPPEVVLASDMLDVATFRGLLADTFAPTRVVVYFHENQLVYPELRVEDHWEPSRVRRARRSELHYAWINFTSCLAADEIWWNSEFNRSSFLDALPRFLDRLPDCRIANPVDDIAARSRVVPLGLDLKGLKGGNPVAKGAAPRVIWNHRWEHDKDPATFAGALLALADRGVDFDVAFLGEAFVTPPEAFEDVRAALGDRVVHYGHVADRKEYGAWLTSGDVVVSTARQEFFGAAVAEAVASGCLPLLPRRLAYPELIPQEYRATCLYDGVADLIDRLAAALEAPRRAPDGLRKHMSAFDWDVMAPRYDSLLDDVAHSRAARALAEVAAR